MKKDTMIREILMAVNANAEATRGRQNQTRRADGDLFFSLAFMTEKQLIKICKQIGINTN